MQVSDRTNQGFRQCISHVFLHLPQRFLFEIEQIGLEKGLVDINYDKCNTTKHK